jgi:signal transduction histidine kinase
MDSARAAWRWWRRSPAQDAVYALVMTAVIVAGSYGEAHPAQISDKLPAGSAAAHTPAAAFVLVAVACLVLAGRYRWPVPVLAISAAAVTAYTALGYVNGAALLAPVVALYAVAISVSTRRAIACAAVTMAVLMAASAATDPFGITAGGFYIIPAMVAIACLGGIAIANRRAYVASIQARADQDARRQVDEERLRIARELHDVVAHTMATINVQAGVAAHILTDRPDAAAEALQTIKAASKEGLRELRAILNVLRQADEADPIQPAPGLAQIATLIAGAQRAGLNTTLAVTGPERPLPAAVDLAAYRIVQESLTNAIRHAGPATAAVSLAYDESELRIEVTDTGRGYAPAAGSHHQGNPENGGEKSGTQETGHGLTGMRERAASVGGTVDAGPSPAGGYRVAARLPTGRSQSAAGAYGAIGAYGAAGARDTDGVDAAGVAGATGAAGVGEASATQNPGNRAAERTWP